MITFASLVLAALQVPAPSEAQSIGFACRGVGSDNENVSLLVRVGRTRGDHLAIRFEGVTGIPGPHSASLFKVERFDVRSNAGPNFLHEAYLFAAAGSTYRLYLSRHSTDGEPVASFALAPGSFDPFRGYIAAGTCQPVGSDVPVADAAELRESLSPEHAIDQARIGMSGYRVATNWTCDLIDREGRRHPASVSIGVGNAPSASVSWGVGELALRLEAPSSHTAAMSYSSGQMTLYTTFTDVAGSGIVEVIGMPQIAWVSITGASGPLSGRCAFVPPSAQ